MKKWKSRSGKLVFKNPFLDFYEYKVERPNGKILPYYCVSKAPSCLIIPVDGKYTYLTKQYRFAATNFSWEFPGGGVDSKSPRVSAKKELLEETGLKAKKMVKISSFFINTGYSNQKCYVFAAYGLTQGRIKHEKDEFLEIYKVTFKEVEAKILSGEVLDGPSISAYYLFKAHNTKSP